MLFLLVAILLCASLATPSVAAETITNVTELARLVQCNAGDGRTFDLTACVVRDTFALEEDPTLNRGFNVSDGSNGVAVALHKLPSGLRLRAGDRVHITGYVKHPAHMHVQPHAQTVTVLGSGTPPKPHDCSAADVAAGRYDEQFIRVSGTVIDTYYDDLDPRFTFFVLAEGSTVLYAPLCRRPPLDELRKLIGARVAIVGICNRPSTSRPYLTREISLATPDDLTVLVPPPSDPFAVPELFSVTAPATQGYGRRRVLGRVLAAWGKDRVLLRATNEKAVRVTVADGPLPAPGDCVEAAGQPDTDIFSLNLTQAIWRKHPDVRIYEPPTQSVTPRSLLYDASGQRRVAILLHGQTVRLRGTVRGFVEHFDGRTVLLDGDNVIISLHEGSARGAFDNLPVGGTVEATGTCVLEVEPFRPQAPSPRAKGVFVVLRTGDDLRILARPPWWTPARLIVLLAVTFLGSLVVVVWNRLLKRRIELRSRELLDEQIAHVTSELKTMERTRLAIELHDAISQNLTGVALELQTAKDTLREDLDQTAHHLAIADRSLMSCREELRNCLSDLRSTALEVDDVNKAIRLTLAPYDGDAAITVRFNVPRDRITDNTMHALLRIIRELVVNAIRHGRADTIRVAGAIEDGKLLFSVTDDGCGFDPANHPSVPDGHFGLQGIQDRIDAFAGTMTVDSAIGRGTRVAIAITLPKETTDEEDNRVDRR